MVESIHNNESELSGKKKAYETIRLPKNLRQVGQVDGNKRIYIEDYVMTYIKQLGMKSYGTYQVAVLLGEIRKVEQVEYIFISGAVEVRDVLFDDDKVFDNESWTKIYDDIKRYFSELEIVGWYITRPGLDLVLTERIRKIHIDNFAGTNKVLLMYDSVEREEVFYLYHNKNLVKQEGYYVYYERNDLMQTYMIDHKDKPSIEADYVDKASVNIRSLLERKTSDKEVKSKNNSVSYAAASVAAIIVLFGVGLYLSGQNPDSVGTNLPVVKKNASAEPSKDSSTTVNIQPGNITSIKDEEVKGDKTNPTTSVAPSMEPSVAPTVAPTVTPTATPVPTVAPTVKPSSSDTDSTNKAPSYHTVVKGDTLISISIKYYSSKQYMDAIMEANGITDSDKIYIGQKIVLP